MKLFFIFLINLSLSIFAIANDEMNILTSSGDVTGIKKNNVIKIKPPLIFTKEHCNKFIFYLNKILEENFLNK